MSPNVIPTPQLSIEYEREQIDVTLIGGEKTPDQKWRHIDSHGHLHAFDGDDLPSLEWVVTGTKWVGDEYDATEYDVGEYRCRACAEVVEPIYKTDHSRKFVPGPATVTVSIAGEKFVLAEETYAEALDAWADVLRERT